MSHPSSSRSPNIDQFNIAAICGTISSEPRERELPSGSRVINLEVTVRQDDLTSSVPVVVYDRDAPVNVGDEVVVTGHIARRFFRAGGATQSRTELVATSVTPTRRKRAAERALSTLHAAIPQ